MSGYDSASQQDLFLSSNQQNLLLTALMSNSQNTHDSSGKRNEYSNDSSSPEGVPGSGQLSFGAPEDSPFIDYNDVDGEFDFTNEDLIGELPEELQPQEHEAREKRKISEGPSPEDGGKKRKEGEAKKPGRKPLTSEPTTKRKAQNRAAQRAFRERKEKHLKDLETKVDELEKQSKTTNDENLILRVQVERLQVELKEYRKRMARLSGGKGLSQPTASNGDFRNNQPFLNNEFAFEFPKFGDLPKSHLFNDTYQPKPQAQSYNYPNSQVSPHSTSGGSSISRASVHGRNSFNSGRLGSLYNNENANFIKHGDENSVGPFSDSPSATSESYTGHISSIGTSPEPTSNSPQVKRVDSVVNGRIGSSYKSSNSSTSNLHENRSGGQKEFCDRLSEACGSVDNPIPADMTKRPEKFNNASATPVGTNFNHLNNSGNHDNNSFGFGESIPSFDWLAQQNGGRFDPLLFDEYRDPQDAVLSQDLNDFFNDALPFPELDGVLNQYHPNGPIATADAAAIGNVDVKGNPVVKEEMVPADKSQMISCTDVWDKLQSMDQFRSGEVDIDNLCTELKTKAKCSEHGVVIDKNDVEAIMTKPR